MIIHPCIACRNQIKIGFTPAIGDQIICKTCHNTLEVIWLYPLVLDIFEEQPAENPLGQADPNHPNHFPPLQ